MATAVARKPAKCAQVARRFNRGYLYHFGLNELPFTLTPNTHYYYGLPTTGKALDVLNVALQTGEGFIKVIGEVGTGKTLVCQKLTQRVTRGVCLCICSQSLSLT